MDIIDLSSNAPHDDDSLPPRVVLDVDPELANVPAHRAPARPQRTPGRAKRPPGYPAEYPTAPPGSSLDVVLCALARHGADYGGMFNGNGKFTCPVHADTSPSLDIAAGQNRPVILNCKPCEGAGTPQWQLAEEFCDALSIDESVLSEEPAGAASPSVWLTTGKATVALKSRGGSGAGSSHSGDVIRQYFFYYDTEGRAAWRVTRINDAEGRKVGCPRHVKRGEHWLTEKEWKAQTDERLPHMLYNLRAVRQRADAGKGVWLVEGEKSADIINALPGQHVATTILGGSGAPLQLEHIEQLRGVSEGREIADNDISGVKAALVRAAAIREAGIPCTVWRSKTDGKGDDIEQHLKDGGELTAKGPNALLPVDEAYLAQLIAEEKAAKEAAEAEREATSGAPAASPEKPTAPYGRAPRRVVATSLADVKPKNTKWLYEGLIPLGHLALLAGPPGTGKSTSAYDISARVTRGELAGEYKSHPSPVLLVATEDSLAHTVVPRLVAAGADMNLVRSLTAERAGSETPLDISLDIDELEALIRRHSARLLILDPLMSRLSAKTDSHVDKDVRRDLEPLSAMLDRTQCAAVGLIHLNKGDHSDPLRALMGSTAFGAVARSVLYVVRDPDDRDVRLFGQAKNNLGPEYPGTMPFTIETVVVPGVDDAGQPDTVKTSKIVWSDGTDDRTIRDVISAERKTTHGKTIPAQVAERVVAYLHANGGSAPRADIEANIEDAETFKPDHFNRALREQLKGVVESTRAAERGGPTVWSLVDRSRLTIGMEARVA